MGTVMVELDLGADARRVVDEVKSNVDAITSFPTDTEKSIIRELTNRLQIVDSAVSDDMDPFTGEFRPTGGNFETAGLALAVREAGVHRFRPDIVVITVPSVGCSPWPRRAPGSAGGRWRTARRAPNPADEAEPEPLRLPAACTRWNRPTVCWPRATTRWPCAITGPRTSAAFLVILAVPTRPATDGAGRRQTWSQPCGE